MCKGHMGSKRGRDRTWTLTPYSWPFKVRLSRNMEGNLSCELYQWWNFDFSCLSMHWLYWGATHQMNTSRCQIIDWRDDSHFLALQKGQSPCPVLWHFCFSFNLRHEAPCRLAQVYGSTSRLFAFLVGTLVGWVQLGQEYDSGDLG